jgi:caffeoyl-CoA O-methyltransferase
MAERRQCDLRDVQDYFEKLLPAEIRALEDESKPGQGQVAQPTIGPSVAQLVDVLILSARPQRVLEIGTSTGYSAIAMGRALRMVGGLLTTIEIDPRLAEAAIRNIGEAGLEDVVEVVVDDANHVIGDLSETFGLVLQDGDKEDYLGMLPRLVALLAPHGLLITDDVLFPVMDLPEEARRYQYALGLYNEALHNRPDLQTVWLPIGDGVAVSVRLESGGG